MAQDVDGFKATAEEILRSDLSDGAKLAALAELVGADSPAAVAVMLRKSPRTIERHWSEAKRLRKSADKVADISADNYADLRTEVRTEVRTDTRICVPSRVEDNNINNTNQEVIYNNTPLPPKLKTKPEGPTPMQALQAFEAYNAKALELGLPQAAKLTPDRSRRIIARLRDYGLDGWQRALENIGRSKFLMGETPQNFRADLDFLCQAKSLGKLHDGGYGSDRTPRAKTTATAAPMRRLTDEEKFEQSLPWLKQMGLISDELAN